MSYTIDPYTATLRGQLSRAKARGDVDVAAELSRDLAALRVRKFVRDNLAQCRASDLAGIGSELLAAAGSVQ